jgi:hypothetical protein
MERSYGNVRTARRHTGPKIALLLMIILYANDKLFLIISLYLLTRKLKLLTNSRIQSSSLASNITPQNFTTPPPLQAVSKTRHFVEFKSARSGDGVVKF